MGFRNKVWFWGLYGFVFCILSFLVVVGLTSKIFYHDSYEIFTNAFAIFKPFPFLISRPPLLPLLYSPIFYFFSLEVALILIRLLAIGFSLCFLWVCWRYFREEFAEEGWDFLLFIWVVFLCNRLVWHYFSEPMQDVPGALAFLLSFLYYRKGKRAGRYFWFCGFWIGVGLCFRANFLILLGSYPLALFIWYRGRIGSWTFWRSCLLVSIFPFFLAFLVYFLQYYLIERDLWLSLEKLYLSFYLNFKVNVNLVDLPTDVVYEYPLYFLHSGGVFFFFLSIIGLVHLWKGRRNLDELSLPLFFLIMMTYIRHKEARYILPLFPFAYVWMGKAIVYLRERWEMRYGKVVLGLVFFSALYPAVAEGIVLSDGFYRYDFVGKVAGFVRGISPERYYFAQNFYTLYPPSYRSWYHFSDYDEFYHLRHISVSAFAPYVGYGGFYLADKHLAEWDGETFPRFLSQLEGSIVLMGSKVSSFSRLVEDYDLPFRVLVVKKRLFSWRGGEWRSGKLVIRRGGKGLEFLGNFPFPFEIYAHRGGKLRLLAMVWRRGIFLRYGKKGVERMSWIPLSRDFRGELAIYFCEVKNFYRWRVGKGS